MQQTNSNSRRDAYFGILLLGMVSLMGDIVYEGSRGIVPSYLEFLGATALVVGLVGGLGDFLGYAIRLVSGFLADTTRAYWLFIFLGYGLIISIPLLGLPIGLEIAVALVLLERFGKAIRSPSRDTVLSFISKDVGAGKAFGMHELLDQIGAVLGPSIVASIMFSTSNYNFTFSFLFIPFLILLAVLAYTYKRIGPKAVMLKMEKTEGKRGRLVKPFYIYTLAVLLNTAGLIPYTLILFRASEILKPTGQDWIVPLIYLLIQGVDAPIALVAGYAYDKFGVGILIMPFLLSLFPSLLTIASTELTLIIVAAAIFGLVLGMQESIYRAAVSELTPLSSRGVAYGIFNTVYGIGFLISGTIFGLVMETNISFIFAVIYVFVTQITAITSLVTIRSELKNKNNE